MNRRASLRPLEPVKKTPGFHIDAEPAQLVADVRAHFPEFEAQLTREFPDCPLDAFAAQPPGALLYVLMRLTDSEHRRRTRFIASRLRAGPARDDVEALERFAIQEEGAQTGATSKTGRPGTAPPDRVDEPSGLPS